MHIADESGAATPDGSAPEGRAARLDDAIAESQRMEREEREHDLEKQRRADERIVRALSERPAE